MGKQVALYVCVCVLGNRHVCVVHVPPAAWHSPPTVSQSRLTGNKGVNRISGSLSQVCRSRGMTVHTKAGALSPRLDQDALNSTFDPLGCYCAAEKCRAQDLRLLTTPGSDWLKHNELQFLVNSQPHPVRINRHRLTGLFNMILWIWCYLMETHTGKLFLIRHSLGSLSEFLCITCWAWKVFP